MTEKYNCASCEYYRANPMLEQPGLIAANDNNGSRAKSDSAGLCHAKPPAFHMIMVPSKLDPRVGQMQQLPVYPIVNESATCQYHSGRVELLFKGAIRFAIRTSREWLDYRPGQNDDRIAAGFSRMPNIAEAMRLSRGADRKPGEALPADTASPAPPNAGKSTVPAKLAKQQSEPAPKPAPRRDTWLGAILKRALNWTRGI